MKTNRKVTLFIATLLLIASCSKDVSFRPYSGSIKDEDSYVLEDHGTYYKPAGYSINYIDVLKSDPTPSSKVIPLRSTGEQKLLVLPVTFPDYPLNNLDGKDGEIAHINLENAFFGENNQTSWRSVSGFYDESSYGKLKITGEVAPWYTLPSGYTIPEIRERIRNTSDKLNETARIANLALVEYHKNNPGKLKEFDTDNDGIIDGIYVVYASPQETKENNNIFWAFASNMNRLESQIPVQANAYSWSSYHYLEVDQFAKPNAHTYIHEVGHILGLTDYYNTNYSDPYSPLGGFDMMDYTLGDHTGLSKMLLNWTRPYIVEETSTIQLHSFSESGQLILLKNNWSGSATDEYLLLEYYTPTALNELDSTFNAPFKLPKASGVKIYHVDARTVYEIKDGPISRYEYTNDHLIPLSWPMALAHSNSSGAYNNAPKRDYKLYSLLEPKESTNINGDFKLANSNSLFKKGDDFAINNFKEFIFNDGTLFNYKVLVEDVNRQYATIKVEVV